MKTVLFFAFSLLLTLRTQAADSLAVPLIPQPVSLQVGKGAFALTPAVKLMIPAGNAECRQLAQLFAKRLAEPTGFSLPVVDNRKAGTGERVIRLALNATPDAKIGPEGYTLQVTPAAVLLTANALAGLFYGTQTLLQLLPPAVESHSLIRGGSWSIPAVQITDYPRFGWRGLMLDVSRHFFPKEYIKQYIDQMVKYKYNVFHWHLTDDQGWRIEIKSLPKLTQIGAWRVPRTGNWWSYEKPKSGEPATYGGFYTQDDIREVIQYAKERQVTIIPEIDVPGHSLAAIAAYPELSSTGLQYFVNPGSKFYKEEDNALNPGKEETFQFLDKVFTEVAALFPAPYIHIGGDECYKGFWEKNKECQARMQQEGLKNVEELQSYFVKRLEKMLQTKGKKLLGWDEILEGGLAPEATVMSWQGMKGGIEAARQKHQVIMTPFEFCYLDLYQGDPSTEPDTYSKLRLKTAYQYDPVPEGVDPHYILGGQGNLWTESVPTSRHVEYMTWPRSLALAEVYWSPKEARNWNSFVGRVEQHFRRYDLAGVNYARSLYEPMVAAKINPADSALAVTLTPEIDDVALYYTTDNTLPDSYSTPYTQPFVMPKGASMLRVVTYRKGAPIGRMLAIPTADLKKRR